MPLKWRNVCGGFPEPGLRATLAFGTVARFCCFHRFLRKLTVEKGRISAPIEEILPMDVHGVMLQPLVRVSGTELQRTKSITTLRTLSDRNQTISGRTRSLCEESRIPLRPPYRALSETVFLTDKNQINVICTVIFRSESDYSNYRAQK